jgi:orotate phosphoribosyltransferase
VSREQVIAIVREHGLKESETPFLLASGEESNHFIDGKAALARGEDLLLACKALLNQVAGIDFHAVGGLTMGADQFAHGVAIVAMRDWFVVRKEAKNRGTNRLVEGADIGHGTRVLLVDDVVTTGGSIQQAFDEVVKTGAKVVAAVTLVDRGDVAAEFFRARSIHYRALATYRDLDIPRVGREAVHA